jgi:hypothetical protein
MAFQPVQTATVAEAKALGFSAAEAKLITKENGQFVFSPALAPDRDGFQSVGIAKPGEVQMTPYYGDVTGGYRLTQEQFASAYTPGAGSANTPALAKIMQENEIKAKVAGGMSLADATAQVSAQYGDFGVPLIPGTGTAGTGTVGTAGTGTAGTGTGSSNLGTTPGMNTSMFDSLQAQITALSSAQKSVQETAAEQATLSSKIATDARKSAVAALTERFQEYGLGSLINKIKDLAIDGATESSITLALQETDEYKERFKANQDRIKKGLRVLNPAEYLRVEDGYRQVLRSYGLRQFDTDDYVSQFISNDVSPAEFSNRVVTAVQRVQNADPAVSRQLRDFYGIGQSDLVAYALDPNQQFQKIERQVAAAEIGVAAARQGLQAGVSVAEQLAAQGVTQAEAQRGYATIADILPTAEKLSDIYGTTLDAYGQTEAEQEVFNSLASAQRKRQRLTAREVAAFGGAAGTNKTSLAAPSVGQF